jgi:hypothetical protein
MQSNLIRKIAELGHKAPSADNTQPWRMEWDGTKLSVFYDTDRVEGKTFPAESPASLLSIGALIENVMSVAAAWRLQPRLEVADRPGSGNRALYARISFDLTQEPQLTQKPHPAEARHTNRGAFTADPIPEALSAEFLNGVTGSARTWFSQDKTARLHMAGIVRRASEIRFQTREVHEWLGRSLRFSAESVAEGDGLDVDTLGLPPGGGLFLRMISDWKRMRRLNALGFYKLVAAMDSGPIKAGPGLLAIIAPMDSQSTIDAGRLLARQWTRLNAAGLAVHPYYVVADQMARLTDGKIPGGLEPLASEVSAQCRELLEISGSETLHMLLRIGFSKKNPKKALRVPLDLAYSDITIRQG